MIIFTPHRLANYSLLLLTLFYLIMLGGGNYEQLTITNLVASAPPKSLAMLQGPYGFNPVKFWVTFRPLTILLFIAALFFNWRVSSFRRKLLLFAFVIDCAVTLSTFLYFAPETGVIASAKYDSEVIDSDLFVRLQRWESLNWLRIGAFYTAGILLLLSLNTSLVAEKNE
ncbi:MAG: hypothetical protein ABL895_08820 [Cyclobacteriaceae bacterium]